MKKPCISITIPELKELKILRRIEEKIKKWKACPHPKKVIKVIYESSDIGTIILVCEKCQVKGTFDHFYLNGLIFDPDVEIILYNPNCD